jgi:hypothetical protein
MLRLRADGLCEKAAGALGRRRPFGHILVPAAKLSLLVALSLSSGICLAGPPFFTDDPVPVDPGHWEINNYASGTVANGAFAGILPGVDANYGAVDNVQLHLQVPLALVQSTGVNAQWGLGDVEVGAKYRFISANETDWWPQIAFYPFLDFPTGNADRGLERAPFTRSFQSGYKRISANGRPMAAVVIGSIPAPEIRIFGTRAG